MTQTITTSEINARLQNAKNMSDAELVKFIMHTQNLFESSYQIQKMITKQEHPHFSERECNVEAYDKAWELMKSLGYVYSLSHNGWVFPNMKAE